MDPNRNLPADLLPEILRWLPVKSLLKFRCVSKAWLSLVDEDKNFAQLHLKSFKNNSDKSRIFVVLMSFYEDKPKCEVRSSDKFELMVGSSETPYCNSMSSYSIDGLILLKYTTQTTGLFCDLKVWNPSIGKLREIPPLTEPKLHSAFLVGRDIGFGYDRVTNDYKLVKLIAVNYFSMLHSVATYSIGADSWRIKEFEGGFDWRWNLFSIDDAVYFRGSLYFIASDDFKRVGKGWDLIGFDLSKEVFCSMAVPDDIYFRLVNDCYMWRLGSLDAGLSLQVHNMRSNDIYVWVVDTESMSWNKPHVYSLNRHAGSYLKNNGDMLMWRPAKESGKEVWSDVGSYSRETKEHKPLQQVQGFPKYKFCFVESLILHQ